ncbi:hypothetical protein FD754_004885 [Muntiacus muntjak]|uniref:Cryptic/Cripto CFC domain-containing protein n=1 Tax=Muntiacus muntjak TaxID=9888 RepID=A0A5N3WG33_MUNMU|nr:hypothetical protein FD754_004885 [Muntiacus muntjak]
MAFSRAFELGLVAGLGHHELACPSQGGLPLRDNGLQSQKDPAIGHWASQFVLFRGIQNSKELNRTCCLNGRTCILGSFLCGSVPHDTWLSRKCSMCKCWHGQLCWIPQSFLPGCDEQLTGTGTPELTLSAFSLMLPCYTGINPYLHAIFVMQIS